MASPVRRLLLTSDSLSPNSSPHGLPALLWPGLMSSRLGTSCGSGGGGGPDAIRSQLRSRGWEPQWTFPMFKQAHYHSTVSANSSRCLVSTELRSPIQRKKRRQTADASAGCGSWEALQYCVAKRLSQMQHLTIRNFWWSIRI